MIVSIISSAISSGSNFRHREGYSSSSRSEVVVPITPLMLEETNERLRGEVRKLLQSIRSLPEHVEYLIDKLPSKKIQDNLVFLAARGEEGWIIVDRDGKDVIFVREKR